MLKRMLVLLCCVALMVLLPLASLAVEEGETYYAYFLEGKWLRSKPAGGTSTVTEVKPRTLLKLTQVNATYAQTEVNGKKGYIYTPDAVRIDYTDPDSEDAVTVEGFFGAPVYMRVSPIAGASTMGSLPSDVRFRITYVTNEYARIQYEGQYGYVYRRDFVVMEYPKTQVAPYIAYSDESVNALTSPCYGADTLASIPPYTPITVTGTDGDHITIQYKQTTAYVEKDTLTTLPQDFDVEDFAAKLSGKVTVMAYPLANAGKLGSLKSGTEVTVEAYCGQYARVASGELTGYIPYSKLQSSSQTKAALAALALEEDRLAAHRFLDLAFSMVEKTNPILKAYNTNLGGHAVARFEYGVPYLFAGTKESILLQLRYASQDSNYYSTSRCYLGGFDCIGFARWLHSAAGLKRLPAISEMPAAEKSSLVDISGLAYSQWHSRLKVGDCIAMNHLGGGYHVMMYIGTLRDFGYTAKTAGSLKKYLDYPLAIHCGMNNYHTAWYTQYIKDHHLSGVYPPDGGVTISILGIPTKKVPNTETMWKGTPNEMTFYWFELDGYNLTVSNPVETNRWCVVYRNTEK